MNELVAANNYESFQGVRDVETDVLYCYSVYCEPRFRYAEQEKYWEEQLKNLKSMAHNKLFHRVDQK